uniref:THAP domain-containing protein 11 n=1 Tax=Corvus moneduloides TaxID=1196302 RepID=A0A8C3E1D6_CORMO
MPGFTCCVPGCYNNSHRDKALHFYTFPKDEELRRLWLKNVSRAGVSGCFSTFQPTTGHRVCSEHFQGGRKSDFTCSGCKPFLSNPKLVGMTNNLYIRQNHTKTCLCVLNQDLRVL